ncbi:MAG TPA: helix-turn-helix transcriptional regulator [Solirubrobacteraceae bacterium]
MPASPDPQVALGRAIRLRREELGLEQHSVALDAGIEASWLSHIESGRQNPAWGTVDRIARALGLAHWELAKLADELETADRRPTDEPLRRRD